MTSDPKNDVPFLDRPFSQVELFELICARERDWSPGTVPAVLAAHLREERNVGSKLPLPLKEFDTIKLNKRIDGILPLTIPDTSDIGPLGDELMEQIMFAGLGRPETKTPLQARNELLLCYFAFFHNRELAIDYRLNMEMYLECPISPSYPVIPNLTLVGTLPLGGRIVIFYSSIDAKNWLEMPPEEVRYAESVEARREENGRLRLLEI